MIPNTLSRQLDELQMIQCSLMPGEKLEFVDDANDNWRELLEAQVTDSDASPSSSATPAHLRILLDDAECSVDVVMTSEYDGTLDTAQHLTLDLKGDHVTRTEQERWQKLFLQKLEELDDSEYPLYQLLTIHILPLLHEEATPSRTAPEDTDQVPNQPARPPVICHALLTSHHLISPNKRRSLQGWSSSLKISGFAKVGYPGAIYGTGERENIEEFVTNIKAMQWLALRVRFVEPLPETLLPLSSERSWQEFQKVGEVVEEMRRLGREAYVVEMGIGSAGDKGQSS